jgi:hypothetical protein
VTPRDVTVFFLGDSSMTMNPAEKGTRHKRTKLAQYGGGHVNVVADFDRISDDVFLTEKETAQVAGFSPMTLRNWRIAGEDRGPKVTIVHRSIRYRAGYLREWLRGLAGVEVVKADAKSNAAEADAA